MRIITTLLILSAISFGVDASKDSRGALLGSLISVLGKDVNATSGNPALLAQQDKLQISLTFDTKFELDQKVFSIVNHLVLPIKVLGPIGINFGVLGYFEPNISDSPLYGEINIDIGYALPIKSKRFQLGLTISIDSIHINKNFLSSKAVGNINQANASFNYGIGLNYQIDPTMNIILVLGDFLRATQLAFDRLARIDSSSELSYLRTGISKSTKFVDFGLTVNYVLQQEELKIDIGAEGFLLKELLCLGARMTTLYRNEAFTFRAGFGLGVKVSYYKIDYSLVYPIGESAYSYGDHYISLGVAF